MDDKALILDVKDSDFILDGDLEKQAEVCRDIDTKEKALSTDQSERQTVYTKRINFYQGRQHGYTNVYGKTKKDRKGHTNAVSNYVGKSAIKMVYSLANNPPKYTIPSLPSVDNDIERNRSRNVQKFVDGVLSNKINRFWKKTYRRASVNQVIIADAAIKTYPIIATKEIKIVNHEDMGQILVGWRGDDPTEFDFVITKCRRTAQSIEDEFGFKVPKELINNNDFQNSVSSGSWTGNDVYGTKTGGTDSTLPSGKNSLPGVDLVEYDDENMYALKIGGKLAQLILKDGVKMPKVKFWTIVPNIPNPTKPWSISDIDVLMEPQIELNETDNDARDYIRTGATQRFVAYNMSKFDAESLNSSSGQVIFVDSPDGSSKFEALGTNVNNFPADAFASRKLNQLFDLGLPKVAYGSGAGDSGRSKAIDFQSAVDLTQFKRDAWELALQDIFEKIQVMGHFLYPELDIFSDDTDTFVVREAEFDWVDILPVTQADKIVNVINKLNAGLPFREFYKELGYRDVETILDEMKEEAEDPNLMTIRGKMWQLTEGLIKATQAASVAGQTAEGSQPNPNQGGPALNVSQNGEGAMPMSSANGTTASTTLGGNLRQEAQNVAAQGM